MRQINVSLSMLIIALTSCIVLTAGADNQYESNIFLNGEYQKLVAASSQNAANPLASLISKRASPFVGQMYLPTLLECKGDQFCVLKEKCSNGYFTQASDQKAGVSKRSADLPSH